MKGKKLLSFFPSFFKTEPMRFSLLLLGLLFVGLLSAQVTLRQQTDTEKTTTLKAGGDVRLVMLMEGPSFTEAQREMRGKVSGVNRGLFQFQWETEAKEYTLTTGMKKAELFDYRDMPNLTPMGVDLGEVETIYYRSPKAPRWQRFGKYLMWAGLINAVVVAPIVSANFGEDTFNTNRYGQWAGLSLAASGIGVTIMLTNGYKAFPTKESGRTKAGQPLWML